MDQQLERGILVNEITLLTSEVEARGTSLDAIPHGTEDLLKLSLSDLRQLKRELRDLVRTIGGNR